MFGDSLEGFAGGEGLHCPGGDGECERFRGSAEQEPDLHHDVAQGCPAGAERRGLQTHSGFARRIEVFSAEEFHNLATEAWATIGAVEAIGAIDAVGAIGAVAATVHLSFGRRMRSASLLLPTLRRSSKRLCSPLCLADVHPDLLAHAESSQAEIHIREDVATGPQEPELEGPTGLLRAREGQEARLVRRSHHAERAQHRRGDLPDKKHLGEGCDFRRRSEHRPGGDPE